MACDCHGCKTPKTPLYLKGPSAWLIVRKMTRLAAILICFLGWTATGGADQPRVTVFAAASLRGVFEDIAATSPYDITLSFGGSGTMARQVAKGAPADVVVLANTLWMDWLITQGIAKPEQIKVLATNTLVVIAPVGTGPLGSSGEIPARLADGRLAMGQRDAVPAGTYARQWLENAGLWADVQHRLAETDNVRAALALVARGDVPLGIVYATDALADPAVTVVWHIPKANHDPIQYLATSLTPVGADFLAKLDTPDTARIFATHGFQPVQP